MSRYFPKCFAALALFCALVATALAGAASPGVAAVTQRLPSGIDGVDLVVSYDTKRAARDYSARGSSSLPAKDRYALERGADKGLVHLMNENGRTVKRYSVPRANIRAIVRVKYDMDVLEKADLVFTDDVLVIVHTSSSNAGIFTSSDVYEVAYRGGEIVDRTLIARNEDLAKMVDAGLAVYRSSRRP